jgi:hypothetical protein
MSSTLLFVIPAGSGNLGLCPRRRVLVPAQEGNQKLVAVQEGIRKMLFSRSLCPRRRVAGSGKLEIRKMSFPRRRESSIDRYI